MLDGTGALVSGERFAYDGDSVVLAHDDGGSLTHRFLHGPAVDQVFADEDALGEILWGLDDHQGTIRDVADHDAVTDETNVVNHVTYSAFGEIESQTNAAYEPHFAYTGREWDADAELYYYRARWYDQVAERFLSEDPSGFGGGDANLYRYVQNSPANFTDPTERTAYNPRSGLSAGVQAVGALMGLPFSGAIGPAIQAGALNAVSQGINAVADFGARLWDFGDAVTQFGQDIFSTVVERFTSPGPGLASRSRPPLQDFVLGQRPSGAAMLGLVEPESRDPAELAREDVRADYQQALASWREQLDFAWERHDLARVRELLDQREHIDHDYVLVEQGAMARFAPMDPPQGSGSIFGAIGRDLAISTIPGGGEALDLATLVDPSAPLWVKGIAGASLFVSYMTSGTSPNAGALFRNVDDVGTTLHVGQRGVTRGVDAVRGPSTATSTIIGVGPSGPIFQFGDGFRARTNVVDYSSQLTRNTSNSTATLRNNLDTNSAIHRPHHIITLQARNHPVVEAAARGGFNINGANNGINLDLRVHPQGARHPRYNAAIQRQLDTLATRNLTDEVVSKAFQHSVQAAELNECEKQV